ncbi:MAG: pre-peptidase C-terminal domain-containing protein, partial [Actinomycetota bacterium]|nr:pre-peptidase C-terminal domain-containing protein [Actinomycetota bacterium]
VWYRWTAPVNGPVHMDTWGSDFDTLLAVYTGSSVGGLTEVASNDQDPNGGDTSRLTFTGASGTLYRIAVDGWQGNRGTFVLNIRQPPPNDDFGSAITLTGPNVTRSSDTNRGAAKQTGEPNHAGNAGGASVWYRWTAPSGGRVTIDTAGSNFDTLLAVYRGSSVGSLTHVVSNDEASNDPTSTNHTSKVAFTPTAGTTYRIAVDGFLTGQGPSMGTLKLRLVQAPTITGLSPLSGNPGTAVTVNGTGFTSPITVRFNGTASTGVTIGSTTALTATVPAGATSGKVSVTTPGGTATSAANFLVGAVTQDNNVRVQLNGWRGVGDAAASGGTYRVSSVAGDTARFVFTGTSVRFITRRASDQGIANVTIDGVNKGNFDLYSAATQNQVSLLFGGLPSGSHTIVVKANGTKNAASIGANVSVDGFLVGTTTTQDSATAIRYNDWIGASSPQADAGTYRVASPSTATATFRFTGSSVDLVTAKGPGFGNVRVLIDGVIKATVDLYAATQAFRVVQTYGGLGAGAHTMVVRVLGTKNTSATGTAVPVDAFVVRP